MPPSTERPMQADALADRLRALEEAAGVAERIREARNRPPMGLFGADMVRQRIRRAYFGVRDAALREDLIRTAWLLDRRERFEACRRAGIERLRLARARRRARASALRAMVPFALMAVVPMLAATAFPVQVAGALAIVAGGGWVARCHRQRALRALDDAAARSDRADQAARDAWQRPVLFSAQEASGRPEDLAFGRRSSALGCPAGRALESALAAGHGEVGVAIRRNGAA